MRHVKLYSGIGAVVLIGACLSSALPAMAGPQKAVDHAAEPTVTADGHEFYSQDQIDAAWQKAVGEFTGVLPAGRHFPELAPSFFHPADGTEYSYEAGIPAQIVARYSRCAWLQESDAFTPNTVLSVYPESEIDAQLDPAAWQAMPAVKESMDVSAYLASVDDYARATGQDPRAVEFRSECAVYTESNR
ncbi:hypothetical protein W824_15430 [Clavibacter cf. michiganensis LMG 26808]|uniref:Secreted protein n=1 Tax=Clavibacter michiganensis TaxID=28447 RepID=A0A399NUY0_9MICO|nr:hypothetical protein W824_15430 [Clavibacter cf. michiganensis LMG 26808]RII98002.1 hypothetical protein DZF96_04980 [Clavibacter michiganensis]